MFSAQPEKSVRGELRLSLLNAFQTCCEQQNYIMAQWIVTTYDLSQDAGFLKRLTFELSSATKAGDVHTLRWLLSQYRDLWPQNAEGPVLALHVATLSTNNEIVFLLRQSFKWLN